MTILVVSHKYPPSIGGMQKQCYELVQSLKKNHEVIELIYEGKGSNVIFLFTAAIKALFVLKRNPTIDLIYANDGLMSFFLTPVFWFSKKPIFVTIHGLDVVFPLRIYQRWVKKYLNKAKGIIAVSEPTQKEVISRGVKAELVHFVPNGMDSRREQVDTDFSLSRKIGMDLSNKKVIVSIGRGVKRKGFSWFAENVFRKLPENTLYIVIGPRLGDHEKHKSQQRQLPKKLYQLLVLLNGIPVDEIHLYDVRKKYNLEDRVLHLTDLKNEEVAATLKQADLFVMPNLKVEGDYEGFGLVALEAVRAGLLCLAADIDGIPSAIQHDKNGILLPSGDANTWFNYVTKYLEEDGLRKELAKKFRDFAFENSSSWERMTSGYEKIFTDYLEKS